MLDPKSRHASAERAPPSAVKRHRLVHLGREDKVTLRLACPLGDPMVFGRAELDINKTINNDLCRPCQNSAPTGPIR